MYICVSPWLLLKWLRWRKRITQTLLPQRNLCAEEFLYAGGAFTHRSFYTEELLRTEAFNYTEKFLQQRNFYTQKRLHRSFYILRNFTPVCDLRPSLRAKGRRCPATKNLHFTTQLVCASDTHDVRTEKNFKIAILSHDLRRGSRFDGHVKRIWKNLEVGVYWGFSNTSRSPRI